MEKLNKLDQKFRFGLVGIVNTIIDFTVFGALTSLGVNVIFANYVSTSSALIFSYITNKRYTFRRSGENIKRESVLFLLFTLIGLWVIQPLSIAAIVELSHQATNTDPSTSIFWGAKILAVGVTLVWNYATYNKYVFPKTSQNKQDYK